MLRKKGQGTPIAVGAIVLLTLVLTTTAILATTTRDDKIEQRLFSSGALERAYARAEIVDFYLEETLSKIESKEGFITEFSERLNELKTKGKYPDPALEQVERQADNEHIKVEGGVLKADFEIIFIDKVWDPRSPENLIYEFTYTHKFSSEKQLVES